jgi:hypothetical protein
MTGQGFVKLENNMRILEMLIIIHFRMMPAVQDTADQ